MRRVETAGLLAAGIADLGNLLTVISGPPPPPRRAPHWLPDALTVAQGLCARQSV